MSSILLVLPEHYIISPWIYPFNLMLLYFAALHLEGIFYMEWYVTAESPTLF